MTVSDSQSLKRRIGWGLFVAGLLLYGLTAAKGAFPGIPALLLAQHLGLDPFAPMSHPLWNLLVRFVAMLPFGDPVRIVNVLSALFAAAILPFVFSLVWQVSVYHKPKGGVHEGDAALVGRYISAGVAVAILALCIPFWFIATRAHTMAFDVLLLVLCLHLLLKFGEDTSIRVLYILAFVWGLVTTEFATCITLTPIVLFMVLYRLWRVGELRWKTGLTAVMLYLLGLSVYFIQAGIYMHEPVTEWRQFVGFHSVLWFIWREQYWAIAKSLGTVGWLLVFMSTILPALFVFLVHARRPKEASHGGGTYFLFFVLTALAALVALSLPPSPWPVLGLRPLVVTPYLLFAAWAGYVIGFWYVVITDASPFDAPIVQMIRKGFRVVYIPILAACCIALGVKNWASVDPRPGDLVDSIAKEIVSSMDQRTWLVSNGVLDSHLMIAAAEQGLDLKLVNPRFSQSKPYLKYVASLVENPRLRSLATIGVDPLLREWLESDTDADKELAVLSNADLWMAGSHSLRPNKLLFLGEKGDIGAQLKEGFGEQETFWNTFGTAMMTEVPDDNLAMPWHIWARGQMSKVANNYGVALEEVGASKEAFAAYKQARRILPDNVSALLNMVSLSGREKWPEAAELQAEFDKLADHLTAKLGIWGLSYQYGYVRHPEAYANRGYVWAMSGKETLAIHEMKKAIDMGAGGSSLQMALANLYYVADQQEESRASYEAVLAEQPDNPAALLGLARLAAKSGDFDTARGYLSYLRELGVKESLVDLEQSVLEMLAGDLAIARDLLEGVLKSESDNYRAWVAYALLGVGMADDEMIDKAGEVLSLQASTIPGLRMALAQIDIQRRDFQKARQHLETLLREKVTLVTLEQLLRLDVRQGLRDEAEAHLAQILRLDSHNAYANHVLGSVQIGRGEFALAEESYRMSLRGQITPETLNDLAWLLQRRGAYEEALPLVEQALATSKSASTWDTYAVILLALGRLDDAEKALGSALALSPNHPEMIFHLAQIYAAGGDKEKALNTATPLLERMLEMSPDSYEEVRMFVIKLREN